MLPRLAEAKVPNPEGLDRTVEARACDRFYDGLCQVLDWGVTRPLKRGCDVAPNRSASESHCLGIQILSPNSQDKRAHRILTIGGNVA